METSSSNKYKKRTGLDINLGLIKLWKKYSKLCLQHAIELNDNDLNNNTLNNNDNLFIEDDIKHDDIKYKLENNEKNQLLQILSGIKFFNLILFGENDIKNRDCVQITDCAKFLCRINITDLMKDKKENIYNYNKYIHIEFIIDNGSNCSLDSFDINYLKHRNRNVSICKCFFVQFPNHIYNELFIYIKEQDLIYTIIDYLSFQDYTKNDNSKNYLKYNLKPQTITKLEMLQYKFIAIYKELIISNNNDNNDDDDDVNGGNDGGNDNDEYFIKYKNNIKFICNSYGNIDYNKFILILRSISFISKYWNEPNNTNKLNKNNKYGWRTLEEDDFRNGYSIDVRYTDEHNETFWTIGTICNVQTDRLLIHIPRHGAVWRNKTSNDIAPTGLHTDGFA